MRRGVLAAAVSTAYDRVHWPVGKRRHGAPDRFGEGGGFSTLKEPLDDSATKFALERFVATFVSKVKRERALMLLGGSGRIEGLQRLHDWIDVKFQTLLQGSLGFPQHLQARFGDLQGVLVDDRGAWRTTIAGASWSAAGGFGALFVSDAGDLALLLAEIGPTTLVSALARR